MPEYRILNPSVFPSEKQCARCGVVKSLEEFGRDRSRDDGRFPYCKRCRLRNPERSDADEVNRAIGLRRCSTCARYLPLEAFYPNPSRKGGLHHDCKDCSCAHARDYIRKNPEKAAEAWRQHRETHREERKANYDQWRRTPNGLAAKARGRQKRRAQCASVLATLTGDEWQGILESQGNRCVMCDRAFGPELPATMDHIIPVSRGGGLTRENIQGLCRSCNSRKKDHPHFLEVFADDIPGLARFLAELFTHDEWLTLKAEGDRQFGGA